MKKTCATFLLLIVSIFALSASPEAKTHIRQDSLAESRETANNPVLQRMDIITEKVDAMQTQMASDSEKSWLGLDIDRSNMWVAFWGLVTGIIALAVGIIGTWYGYRGYKESRRTADNVMRASLNVLEGQFNDLIRHLYRNLVCTLAFSRKILESASGETVRHYPSEEHLLKLQILSEDALLLEKYNDDPAIYQKMHELKLLFRNYHIEIDTALMHLKSRSVKLDAVKNDLDTLAYKPLHLIESIRQITDQIMTRKGGNPAYDASKNVATIMTREHISKVDDWGKKGSKWGTYVNLGEEIEKEGEKPYDGLRRSRNRLSGKAGFRPLRHEDIFTSKDKTEGKEDNYREQIGKICKSIQDTTNFQDSMLWEYDFEQYFPTMLSIDVSIELDNIHMIALDEA